MYEVHTDVNGPGRGGAREGAGRKPAGYEKPQERIDYDVAKARSEAAKADKLEFDLKIAQGEYVTRESVQAASAAAMAAVAQTLRSIPDNLERKLGVSPEVAQEVGILLDEAMNTLADELERMGRDGF